MLQIRGYRRILFSVAAHFDIQQIKTRYPFCFLVVGLLVVGSLVVGRLVVGLIVVGLVVVGLDVRGAIVGLDVVGIDVRVSESMSGFLKPGRNPRS